MIKVVGLQTAIQGTEKVFESLQDKILNKHLLYNLLESFVRELIPELQTTRLSQQNKIYLWEKSNKVIQITTAYEQ